jgi:HemY protein
VSPAFWILGALLAGSLAAHVLLPDNGYVLVSFRGYVIEMSVPVLAFCAVAAYVAVRLLVGLWRAPRRLGAALARSRARQAGLQATRGYIALAEGRLAQGERLLTKDVRRSEAPLLNYLAAARAAQMQGDRDRRDLWLRPPMPCC